MTEIQFHGGHGRRLLLLHSGFSLWVEWRRAINDLVKEFEVFAPTLPGSTGAVALTSGHLLREHAAFVETRLDDLGWTSGVTVAGSSFGGCVAMELLARRRVERAVALAPPWTTGAGLPFYAAAFGFYLTALRLDRPLWDRIAGAPRVSGLLVQGAAQPMAIDDEDVLATMKSWAEFPVFRSGVRSLPDGPGMPDLSAIDQDRLALVWGSRDPVVPRWMRRRWETALPSAHVVSLEGFPHMPHLRDPVRIVDLLREVVSTN